MHGSAEPVASSEMNDNECHHVLAWRSGLHERSTDLPRYGPASTSNHRSTLSEGFCLKATGTGSPNRVLARNFSRAFGFGRSCWPAAAFSVPFVLGVFQYTSGQPGPAALQPQPTCRAQNSLSRDGDALTGLKSHAIPKFRQRNPKPCEKCGLGSKKSGPQLFPGCWRGGRPVGTQLGCVRGMLPYHGAH